MAKKIVHIAMALLLFVFTPGLNVNIHYCEGTIANVAFSSAYQTCCGDGEVNCCHIITESFHLDYYNLPVQLNFQPEDYTENSLAVMESIPDFSMVQTFVHAYFNEGNAPPGPGRMKTVLARLQSYLL